MIRIPAKWAHLKYWESGEWHVVKERLQKLSDGNVSWNPGPDNLFANLNALDLTRVKVVIVGQDPYPNPDHAMGHAFSIPAHIKHYPPSLAMIVKELQFDCENFTFSNGSLLPWVKQGVLLWNAYPSCLSWRSLSHNWPEWEPLTIELLKSLEFKVTCFFGAGAKSFSKYVDEDKNDILWTSHPSPRGQIRAKNPFFGSRIFSTINAKLEEFKAGRIDWRL